MESSLHAYLKPLRESGASLDYIEAVERNAYPLAERNLPVLLTLKQLAHSTGVPHGLLRSIVRREVDPYRVFSIRKRSGGKRYICVPEPVLLRVQRWIHCHILCSEYALKGLSRNATAYRPGSSHILNAQRHVGAACVLKLDIKSFFEFISERQIYRFYRALGYRALVAFFLSRICTRVLPAHVDRRSSKKRWRSGRHWKILSSRVMGHLPQGAPTSPMLANLVCVSLDSELQRLAGREGLIYTRYADDMTFSGQLSDRTSVAKLIGEIFALVGKHGLVINPKKTSIAKNGARKIVTGLSIDGDEVRLPRSFKDKLRKDLYFLGKFGLDGHCTRIGQKNHLSYLLHLDGQIRYAIKVEPIVGGVYSKEFNRMFPDFSQLRQLIDLE